jgi:hypothetical protein
LRAFYGELLKPFAPWNFQGDNKYGRISVIMPVGGLMKIRNLFKAVAVDSEMDTICGRGWYRPMNSIFIRTL